MVHLWNGQKAEWYLVFAEQKEGENRGKSLELNFEYKTEQPQLVVGLGKREDFTPLIARRAVAKGIKELQKLSASTVVIKTELLQELLDKQGISIAAEAAKLSTFQHENWKSESTEKNLTVYIEGGHQRKAEDLIAEAILLTEAVIFARNLTNEPPNKLYPETLAERFTASGKRSGIKTEVLDEKAMIELGMGSLLAVGQSSGRTPKLIIMSYMGNPSSKEVLAIVGKAVTCDTGGYCLKPGASIPAMRGDMAGGAAAGAVMSTVADMKLAINVVAVIPAVENRISRSSFLPGDVLTSMSGRTIEIGNTDAEGRLILVDAITYAIRKLGATRIIDIATLTGAVVTMLGHTTAGLMTNNDDFYNEFMEAANTAGEQYWKLPSFPEYRKMIESPVADVYNMSHDGCGTITAGLFIESFTEDKPWIHLDIAGTAWTDPPRMEFQSKFGTGAGVTSLYHICKLLAEKGW